MSGSSAAASVAPTDAPSASSSSDVIPIRRSTKRSGSLKYFTRISAPTVVSFSRSTEAPSANTGSASEKPAFCAALTAESNMASVLSQGRPPSAAPAKFLRLITVIGTFTVSFSAARSSPVTAVTNAKKSSTTTEGGIVCPFSYPSEYDTKNFSRAASSKSKKMLRLSIRLSRSPRRAVTPFSRPAAIRSNSSVRFNPGKALPRSNPRIATALKGSPRNAAIPANVTPDGVR